MNLSSLFPDFNDPNTQQRIHDLIKSYKPPKCRHPIHHLNKHEDATHIIIEILTAIPDKNWAPQRQYEYHLMDESSRKNIDPNYSNFYVEKNWNEIGCEENRSPEDPSEYLSVMCKNCWIDSIPRLQIILQHIVSTQTKVTAQEYIKSFDGFMHFLFMKYLLQQLNLLKYILQHKQLYELFFDYLINIINILHVKSSLHLFIQTKQSIGAPPFDINNPKNNNATVILPQTHEQCEGTYLSRMILNEMRVGGAFMYTTKYWKKKHFKYVFKNKRMLSLIQNDILNRCFERCADLHFYPRAEFNVEYRLGSVHSDIILWLFIYRKFIKKHKRHKQKKWAAINNLQLVIKISQFMMYLSFKSSFPYLKHESLMKLAESRATHDNIRSIIDRWPSDMLSFKLCMDALISMTDDKINHVYERWITQFGKEHFYEMMICNSPDCKTRRWKKEYKFDRQQSFNVWSSPKTKFTKTKFYKCKNCRIAFYCSKHCQKVHWNLYQHKEQCSAL